MKWAASLFMLGAAIPLPPPDLRADTMATVAFVSEPARLCGRPPTGFTYKGCLKTYPGGAQIMVLPNPCPYAITEPFARIACHELGHARGWPADHSN